jgi:cation diffusion facilitator CzcD-associated flavoprotein CzcO
MYSTTKQDSVAHEPTIQVDVIIVGAGVSGIGSAYHLQSQCPNKSFIILEAHEDFGGTWYTHRYPGIRADSDLYTYSYSFKPWLGDVTATGEEIRKYLQEVIEENELRKHIRFRHRVRSAKWSSDTNRWTLEVTREDTGDVLTFSTHFLWMCQGYYRHDMGYTPDWEGLAEFEGTVVHPQSWPKDLEYKNKRVIVIGSGATAATLIPAIAGDCQHVTMLQRSPTYFASEFFGLEFLKELKSLDLESEWIHEIMRRKSLRDEAIFNERSFSEPDVVRDELIEGVRSHLGPDYDIATHFTPRYRPWRQRLAYVPGGDLFKAIKAGQVSVVTGEIERFLPTGIVVKSGELLEADIVITATGFHMSVMGDVAFTVDGKPLDFADTITFHGMMFTGVPNLAWVFGYLRASWTPRVDVVAEFVCRLLNHMEAKGLSRAVPRLDPETEGVIVGPWTDPENFNAGYLMRSLHLLPKAGNTAEWRHTQNYLSEKERFAAIDLDHCALVFG